MLFNYSLPKRKEVIVFLFIQLFCGQIYAQKDQHYVPFFIDSIDAKGVAYFDNVLKQEKDTIKLSGKQARDYATKSFTAYNTLFKDYVKYNVMLTYTEADSLLQRVVENILKANPQLNGISKVYLTRDLEPNAVSMGNGLTLVNIGLIRLLDNESQLAFVICHEFAHIYLKHSVNAIYTTATYEIDEETQKKFKELRKQEYNVVKSLEDILLPRLLTNRAFRRQREFEADSLALNFILKTNYDPQAGIATMDILDKVNHNKVEEKVELKKFFTIPQVPERSYWYDYQTTSSLGDFEAEVDSLADSLATHPACPLRKERMQLRLKADQKGDPSLYAENFSELKLASKGEAVQALLDWGYLSHCIFVGLQLLDERPNDLYARSMISLCMSRISRAKKERNAGNYIPLPDPAFGESYNRMLYFLNELTPDEAAGIAYYMVNPSRDEWKQYEYYNVALAWAAYVNKKEEYTALSKEYYKQYPKGRFVKQMNKLPKDPKSH